MAFLACLFLDSAWAIVGALAVVAFMTDLGIPAVWAYMMDVGGRNAAAVFGWGNMWGNLGAAVSPILLIWISTEYSWAHMFYTCAGLFAISTICSFFIDAATPVIREDRHQRESYD